jgi:integrase
MAAHTPGHEDCSACEARRMRIIDAAAFGKLIFSEAADWWLHERRDRVSDRTFGQYVYYVRRLRQFFGGLTLGNIHIGHVESYVEDRLGNVDASLVRHEISCLGQIMTRAGLWSEIKRHYKPPKLKKSSAGKAISEEEEQRLLHVAASNPRWKLAYWGWLLSRTTTAGPGEITHLHLNDIDLAQGILRIRDGLKNKYRERTITLNETARWAVAQMLKRYYRLMSELRISPDPEHYILPGRRRQGRYDPTIPMASWKKAWRALREKAGLPDVRRYDARHLAITALLEDERVSERTVIELAGHVSRKMLNQYSHVRLGPKRAATLKLEVTLPQCVESSVHAPAEIPLITQKTRR